MAKSTSLPIKTLITFLCQQASELFTAYETQKNVISQLQEQLAEEKGRAREMEAELKAEVDNLSKSCHSQQQVSRSINQHVYLLHPKAAREKFSVPCPSPQAGCSFALAVSVFCGI